MSNEKQKIIEVKEFIDIESYLYIDPNYPADVIKADTWKVENEFQEKIDQYEKKGFKKIGPALRKKLNHQNNINTYRYIQRMAKKEGE